MRKHFLGKKKKIKPLHSCWVNVVQRCWGGMSWAQRLPDLITQEEQPLANTESKYLYVEKVNYTHAHTQTASASLFQKLPEKSHKIFNSTERFCPFSQWWEMVILPSKTEFRQDWNYTGLGLTHKAANMDFCPLKRSTNDRKMCWCSQSHFSHKNPASSPWKNFYLLLGIYLTSLFLKQETNLIRL